MASSIIFSKKPLSVTPKLMENSLRLLSPSRFVSIVSPSSSCPLSFLHLKNKERPLTGGLVFGPSNYESAAAYDRPYMPSDIFDDYMEKVPDEDMYDAAQEESKMKIWSVKQKGDYAVLKVNMPGFAKDHVKVTYEEDGRRIVIKAAKEEENSKKSRNLSFNMDPELLKASEMKAEMKHGVLKISIPVVKDEGENVVEVQVE